MISYKASNKQALYCQSLPYHKDSAQLFTRLIERHWPVFLDSGLPPVQGRYDILAADPVKTFTTQAQQTTIESSHKRYTVHTRDPFSLIKEHLQAYSLTAAPSLPFCGGAIGYFGYELGMHLESLPTQADNDITLPTLAVGIYEWAIIVDHTTQCTTFVHQGTPNAAKTKWLWLQSQLSKNNNISQNYQVTSELTSNFTPESYGQAFRQIKQHLIQGDCYQINLAQRFALQVNGSSWALYQTIRQHNPAPFACYMKLPTGTILSYSPERFLQVNNSNVITQPIKGTCPRSHDIQQDKRLAHNLQNSLKDRAENIMIVDLLRNDLGKTCKTGSIFVPQVCQLQSLPAVHHLVSTVRGQIRQDQHPLDVLRHCFPGGSITGAPKIRAMQIINQLEPHPRSVYCGSIGYISNHNTMDTNIAIRTLVHSDDTLYCWAGGGIVYDSEQQSEYQETFDKVARILDVLNNKNIAQMR